MSNKPILSVCIPVYMENKIVGENLYGRIMDMLSYDGNFEIVISDNCSDKEAVELLKSIKDDRLKLYINNVNLGSLKNGFNALDKASGKYSLIMMDKDYLKFDRINDVLNFLDKNEFALGYFDLNSRKNEFKTKVYKNKYHAFFRKAYKSIHPSGNFYNTELLRTLNIKERFSDEKVYGAFLCDFIIAELILKGKFVTISTPFCYMVSPPFNGKKNSQTYSYKKKNMFFFPDNRFNTMEIFARHMQTLKLPYIIYLMALMTLIKMTKNFMTLGYIGFISQGNIRNWYNIPDDVAENISIEDLRRKFMHYLEGTGIFRNKFERLLILSWAKLKWGKYIKNEI